MSWQWRDFFQQVDVFKAVSVRSTLFRNEDFSFPLMKHMEGNLIRTQCHVDWTMQTVYMLRTQSTTPVGHGEPAPYRHVPKT